MASKTTSTDKAQPNALLTFVGEQDAEYFATVVKAASDMGQDDSGGSRELSVRAEGDRIIIGYKEELII